MLVPAWQAVRLAMSAVDKWVLAWPVAGVARQWLAGMRGLGLDPPLVLALYAGEGPPLRLSEDSVHVAFPNEPVPSGDPGLFDRYQATMRALPERLQAALDRFDPTGTARVIVPCAAELTAVGGRQVFGATPASRRLLEDKSRVDAVWDALGVRRLPSRVVALDDATAAHQALDQGSGTVWAGDNTSGIEAGAVATRRVFDDRSEAAARTVFHGRCARVRVQPFARGTPCSVQGLVLPDGTARTRPCEMLVLHDAINGSFQLCGVSNNWDPPASVSAALADIAQRVGRYLGDVHNWRGGFSVDAIAAPSGEVWPTEINARFTAGLALVDGTLPGPSLELMERVLREGGGIGVDSPRLERWIRSSTGKRRFCHARINGLPRPIQEQSMDLIFELEGTSESTATLRWNRSGTSGRLEVELDPLNVPTGTRLGPFVAAAIDHAQHSWNLGLPTLVAG